MGLNCLHLVFVVSGDSVFGQQLCLNTCCALVYLCELTVGLAITDTLCIALRLAMRGNKSVVFRKWDAVVTKCFWRNKTMRKTLGRDEMTIVGAACWFWQLNKNCFVR